MGRDSKRQFGRVSPKHYRGKVKERGGNYAAGKNNDKSKESVKAD